MTAFRMQNAPIHGRFAAFSIQNAVGAACGE
ncbi:MAG: hypothetical protein QOH09_701 [Pseudonocardiales bacterium]|jgi:hypothetical protein|nr:hypothetical protein [Pseudonocardiales bacterium]MDT7714709.1 hypothetical protein [Pseudonocardiales bacterium]